MSSLRVRRWPTLLTAGAVLAASAILAAGGAAASENKAGDSQPAVDRRNAEYRPLPAGESAVAADHPLRRPLKDAREWLANAQRTVHDFRCRVIKRERIEGVLQDYYYIDMWVREEVRVGDRVTSPLAVYMQFLGPSSAEGRRILFVEGSNEGKMLVRKGGGRFEYVVTKIDPDSENTKSESLGHITQSGFVPLLAEIVASIERHMAADPTGKNTIVQQPQKAKVDGRPCHVLRITHPEQQNDLSFHIGTFFIDTDLGVPARIDKRDWPSNPGEPPPVIGEYNYTKVQMNVGLTEKMFDPKLLRSKR